MSWSRPIGCSAAPARRRLPTEAIREMVPWAYDPARKAPLHDRRKGEAIAKRPLSWRFLPPIG
jgi:hypothetical protein